MFLTLSQFLAHFPKITISRQDFIDQFLVTYVGNPTLTDLFNFKSVIKNQSDVRYIDREKVIDYFYDVVVINRHKYLTAFYHSYFEVPDPYSLKWDHVDIYTPQTINLQPIRVIRQLYSQNPTLYYDQMLTAFNSLIDLPLPSLSLQKNDLSRKIVRNLNYLGILHETTITNTVKSKTSFWQSLLNVYNDLRLEDRFFCPSSLGLFLRQKNNTNDINYNNFFYLFQQYQPKASILNPYPINWLLKNVFKGKSLLTPVMSWDAYLVAFMHSDFDEYVGIDVIPSVCNQAQFLFDYYQNDLKPTLTSPTEIDRLNRKTLELYCQPSEYVLNDAKFVKRYQDHFDAILLCCPYWCMEIYKSSNQSTDLYPKYEDWLKEYWERTVQGCVKVLAPTGKFGFIINNYFSLKKEEYQLIQDLNMIVLKYLKLVGVYSLLNRVSPLRVNKKARTEMLFIYEKDKPVPKIKLKK